MAAVQDRLATFSTFSPLVFPHGIRARFDGDGGQVCCWEVRLAAGVKKGKESSDLLQEAVDLEEQAVNLEELVEVLEGEDGGERRQ